MPHRKYAPLHSALLTLALGSLSFPAQAVTFNLTDVGGAAPGSAAGNAFLAAANFWSTYLADPIVVNLDVGFQNLSSTPNVLGQTTSTSQTVSYTSVKNALIADQTTADDAVTAAHLQAGPNIKFLSNQTNGTVFLDQNNTANNAYLSVNTALMKALNLLPNNSITDGGVTFNSLFNFDFDPSDGITSGSFDFVGIAIHEIGHALGFVSGVDTVDYYSANGAGTGQLTSFDGYAIYTVMDLFRYSSTSIANGNGVQDLAIGDRGQYFSTDGGTTNLGAYATGRYNGDGRQASHWKDNLGLGIMDPTIAAGEYGQVTARDLLAFDTIGYNLVFPATPIPAPSAFWLFLLGLWGLRRRVRFS